MDNREDNIVDGNSIGDLDIQGFSDSSTNPWLQDIPGLSEYHVQGNMPSASCCVPSQVDSSQGQEEFEPATFFDLEDPYYLIKAGGVPNTEKIEEYKKLSVYKFALTFEEKEWRKTPPQIYSEELNMLLVTPNNGQNKPKNFIFRTAKEVVGGRLRIAVLFKDKKEQHKKVVMCPKDWTKWAAWAAAANNDLPFILSASSSAQCYPQQGHPVVVVPLAQPYKDNNTDTAEDCYCYPMEFTFPCNTSHLDQDSVTLVVALEAPTESNGRMYRCVGITTVDVRVCASPGRDKDMRENGGKKLKQGASRKRSASESIGMDPSESGTPLLKREEIEAVHSDIGSSGDLVTEMFAAITSSADCFILPPTVGGASEEGPTSTAAPVAKAMDSNHGNIDLAASVNQLQADVAAIRADVAANRADISAIKELLVNLPACQNNVQAADAPTGGDTHSHTEQ